MNLNKTIAIITSALVLVIALISFVLSYHALQGVASINGLDNWWLSHLWPLLVDFSLITFSLSVVTAHLHNESTWKQWVLTIISTGLTIFYNALYSSMIVMSLSRRNTTVSAGMVRVSIWVWIPFSLSCKVLTILSKSDSCSWRWAAMVFRV